MTKITIAASNITAFFFKQKSNEQLSKLIHVLVKIKCRK